MPIPNYQTYTQPLLTELSDGNEKKLFPNLFVLLARNVNSQQSNYQHVFQVVNKLIFIIVLVGQKRI